MAQRWMVWPMVRSNVNQQNMTFQWNAPDEKTFEAVQEEIKRITSNSQDGSGGAGEHSGKRKEWYQVPQDKVGLVIGQRGFVIKGIESISRCYVKVQAQNPGALP